jgi:hypothetical protein
LAGGSSSIFGLSGTDLSALFKPGVMTGALTSPQLIGKNSPNPGQTVWGPDYNNFAPVIGVAWGIPWLNADKTVLRAGYSIAYERNSLVLLSQVYGYVAPGLGQALTCSPGACGMAS